MRSILARRINTSTLSEWLISGLVCPSCHGPLIQLCRIQALKCPTCDHEYRHSAGVVDLRLSSDRYLSLNQERRKAQRLAAYESELSLEALARRYYSMTADVSASRRERFVRHIADAHMRGTALLHRIPADGKILEIGCGTGGFLQAAASAGRDITGIDIASRWLVLARKRLGQSRFQSKVKLLAGCAEKLPFSDGCFDHVVADSLLEHLADVPAAISEMLRVLRPGGTVTLWSPNRFWIGPDPHVGLIGLGFVPRKCAEAYKTARRGAIHLPQLNSPGMWASCISGQAEIELRHAAAADFAAWPAADRSARGHAARALGKLARFPLTRFFCKTFGPVGEIIMVKPGKLQVANDNRNTLQRQRAS